MGSICVTWSEPIRMGANERAVVGVDSIVVRIHGCEPDHRLIRLKCHAAVMTVVGQGRSGNLYARTRDRIHGVKVQIGANRVQDAVRRSDGKVQETSGESDVASDD